MSGLDIPGIGSGLDIKVMVKAIADSEMAPKEQAIKRQESRAEKELSALGRLFGAGGELLRSSQSLQQYSLLVEGDADVLLSRFENFVDTCNQFLKEASSAERGNVKDGLPGSPVVRQPFPAAQSYIRAG